MKLIKLKIFMIGFKLKTIFARVHLSLHETNEMEPKHAQYSKLKQR